MRKILTLMRERRKKNMQIERNCIFNNFIPESFPALLNLFSRNLWREVLRRRSKDEAENSKPIRLHLKCKTKISSSVADSEETIC